MSNKTHGFDYKMPLHPEVPEKFQEAAHQATLALHEKRLAQMKSRSLNIKHLGKTYKQKLGSILGAKQMKKLSKSMIKDIYSVNIDRITQLKAEYEKKARFLHDDFTIQPKLDLATVMAPLPYPKSNNNWCFYSPPYEGYFWSFQWDRSNEPDDPLLVKYLDINNGQIGSSINTRLQGADDNDFLNAEYCTGFQMWHKVQSDGQLEAYLSLRVNDLAYSQKAKDEFGFSTFTQSQFTRPQLRILAPDETWETKNRLLYHHFEHNKGVIFDDEWLFPRNDIHSFYFKSDKIYAAGSWVLLKAVIENISWFEANDYSITTTNNVNLVMDSVAIRST